ncbi:metallophosphoesterase family protein [Nocardioides perillae]|uniref:Calcineurin-like phosphoesterase domain-containing protein n=1 Tax=Nocardioides perillae TaxID=1119534 RepID=A0A7Y9RQR3_9ACTN|nr:hypothetical protein [Nocardioides perillae]
MPSTRALTSRAHRVGRVLVPAAVGLGVAVVVALGLFGVSSREVTVASHDAVVRPSLAADLRGDLVVRTGPVLPDLRLASAAPVGVEVELGKTEARSTGELVQRYAFIASQPEPQRAVVVDAVQDMALAAALRGLAAGTAVVGLWVLVGPRRRRELVASLRRPRAAVAGAVAVAVVVAAWQPWVGLPPPEEEEQAWEPLADFLGPGVPLPPEAADLQVGTGSVISAQTRRLVRSAVDTYDRSRAFYAEAAEAAADLVDDPLLRQPEDGETVALLVSDRHDNVGMDPVARAVADAAGATAVLDAGDDTSTGSRWEAFSLDSLQEAFGDLDRWAVTGNHDNGPFVGERLAELGWTVLDGEVVEGPGGSRLLGVGDPRASGLGTWREETGLSFGEQAERLADAACEAEADGERVATLLVHDANSGRLALDRGCVDLVVGGHLHVPVGPSEVVGEDGDTGWTYTNGTTGGAAYAIAVGSKLRRSADVALLTYRDGRPVGVQGVTLQTNGVFVVRPWQPLTYGEAEPAPERTDVPEPGQQVGPGTVLRPE